mmetsp:Transcript_799/g.2626  ORF Transcript_799/g.2626 Transcript_799/m.2626 type:complete len:206 (+) Transcript_799:463-1080(+)
MLECPLGPRNARLRAQEGLHHLQVLVLAIVDLVHAMVTVPVCGQGGLAFKIGLCQEGADEDRVCRLHKLHDPTSRCIDHGEALRYEVNHPHGDEGDAPLLKEADLDGLVEADSAVVLGQDEDGLPLVDGVLDVPAPDAKPDALPLALKDDAELDVVAEAYPDGFVVQLLGAAGHGAEGEVRISPDALCGHGVHDVVHLRLVPVGQ